MKHWVARWRKRRADPTAERVRDLELRVARLTLSLAQTMEALDNNAMAVVGIQRWLVEQGEMLPGERPPSERRAH